MGGCSHRARQIGSVFTPVGTRDYSSFITRVRQANPQALYIALTGDDATAFLRQAAQFRLFDRVPVVTETVDMLFTRPPAMPPSAWPAAAATASPMTTRRTTPSSPPYAPNTTNCPTPVMASSGRRWRCCGLRY